MTPTKTRPHKPKLAEWTSEIFSFSLSLIQTNPVHPGAAASTAYSSCVIGLIPSSSRALFVMSLARCHQALQSWHNRHTILGM